MSSDRYSECPRCRHVAEEKKRLLQGKAAEAYGVLPYPDFEALRLESEKPLYLEPTFREDWEFYGIEDGVLHAQYGGSCTHCNLRVNLNEEIEFYKP